MSSIRIVPAELDKLEHQNAVLALIDAYARDPMGGGKGLDEEVRARMIPGLRGHPTTLVFLAYEAERAVGIAVCFRGFSTFRALPIINVHDLAVLPEERGRGVGRKLLEAVMERARELGCCKLTLETQEHNQTAQRLYRDLGFEQEGRSAQGAGAIFMSLPL